MTHNVRLTPLTLNTLGKSFNRQHKYVYYYYYYYLKNKKKKKKTGFKISCKLETICMKCQILFAEKIRKKSVK